MIPYAIRRTARVKTVAVAVDPEEGVVLTVPERAGLPQLDAIVRTKARWILARLRRQSELPPPPGASEFVSGESFLYLGRQHRLRVVAGEGPEGALLDHGRLTVRVGGRPDPQARAARVRALLVGWYRGRAAVRLPPIVYRWASNLKVMPSAVRIVTQRLRWGSCDASGVVRLNWRVVGAATRVIEYVVAHELTHLRYPNHTPAFWTTLGRVMPDYEARREQLRRVGRLLAW
jgi:predicted metal-dependent hydrolase